MLHLPGSVRRTREPHSDRRRPEDKGVERILRELKKPGSDDAWARFLHDYSSSLMKVARFHARNADLAQDCFLYICEKLVVQNYRKLQQFDPQRGLPFEAWLTVVSNNLARDWHRQEYGRKRLPTAVKSMDEFDQAVYVLKYMKRLETPACLSTLRERYPRITLKHLSESLSRLHRAFSPEARWHLSFVNQRTAQQHISLESGFIALPATGTADNPESKMAVLQENRQLRAALAKLEPRERLLLRLRFEYQRSLEDTAHIAGCTNLHQARRQVDKALDRLRGLLDTLEK